MQSQTVSFRLLVRLVGIVVFAFTLPQVAHLAFWLIQTFWLEDEITAAQVSLVGVLQYVISPLTQCAIATYLLFGADALIRHCEHEAMLQNASSKPAGAAVPDQPTSS